MTQMPIFDVFLVLLFTFPALVLMRSVLGWRIRRLMLRKSEEALDENTSLAGVEELPAGSALTIREFDFKEVPEAADDARQKAASTARALFKRGWVYEAIACLAYLVAGSLQGLQSEIFPFALGLSLGYLAVISLRFFLNFRTYTKVTGRRAFSGIRSVVGTVVIGPLILLFGIRAQAVPFLLAILAALFIAVASGSLLIQLGMGAAMLLHLVLRIRLFRESQVGENHTLLVLRVFGMDRSAFLTFGHVLDYWRRLGSSFTVVDPSYFRFEYRAMSPRNIAIVFWAVTLFSLLLLLLRPVQIRTRLSSQVTQRLL